MMVLSPEQYLLELNRALRAHPNFLAGMKFVLRPDKGGFDWEPMGILYPHSEVSAQVRKRFTVRFEKHEPLYHFPRR
jgi:hypothetical protein